MQDTIKDNNRTIENGAYSAREFYKHYMKQVDKDTIYDVDYKTYINVIYLYFKELAKLIIDEGRMIKLPSNLGIFSIGKRKLKFTNKMYSTSIDWINTLKYGKRIYYVNDHSDGYKYLFSWDKVGSRLKNISKYKFVPTRTNKRYLASIIKNKVRDYFELR